jgi:hypothetical protein
VFDPGGATEPALAAAARLIGLAVAYWLAVTTALYLLAQVTRIPAAVRAVRWATIGPVRRLIEGVVAGALLATVSLPISVGALTVTGYVPIPAGDSSSPPAPVGDDSDVWPGRFDYLADSPPPMEEEMLETDSNEPGDLFLPVQPIAGPPQRVFSEEGPQVTITLEAVEVTVRPGDHMWQLAEERLVRVLGRAVTDSEVAPYWLQVVGTNQANIRSGDPDLIFPGEVLVLPAVEQ